MSEPTKIQLKGIVNIFLAEYNKENKTSFEWDNDKSYVAKSLDKQWADAIAFDKQGRELQIQHKEVVWDVRSDKIRSGAADKIVNKLIEALKSRRLSEVSVHLNFYQNNIIRSDKDIDEFCFWMVELIRQKFGDGHPKSYHLFLLPNTLKGYWLKIKTSLLVFLSGIKDAFFIAIDRPDKVRQLIFNYHNDDDLFLSKIKYVTSYITVFKNPDQKVPVIGWGHSEQEPRPLPHFGDVVVSEINRNVVNKYNDIIVLLDCNRPVDEYDRNLILSQVRQLTFKGQIWIVENFMHKQKATCIFNSLKQP